MRTGWICGRIVGVAGKAAVEFTKADVANYYIRIAPLILPHLRHRPITLKRFPDGVFGEAFHEKNAPAFAPDWIETFTGAGPPRDATGD